MIPMLTWEAIKGPLLKAAPWIIGVLLIVGSYWYAHHAGVESQKAKDASVIAVQDAAIKQSTANVAVMKKAVDVANADAAARAASFNASKVQDAANIAQANARWEQSEKARASLAEIARSGKSGCKPSAALTKALEGL